MATTRKKGDAAPDTKNEENAKKVAAKKEKTEAKVKEKKAAYEWWFGQDMLNAIAMFEPEMDKVAAVMERHMSKEYLQDDWEYLHKLMVDMSTLANTPGPFITFSGKGLDVKYAKKHAAIYYVRTDAHANACLKFIKSVRNTDSIDDKTRLFRTYMAAQHVYFYVIATEK